MLWVPAARSSWGCIKAFACVFVYWWLLHLEITSRASCGARELAQMAGDATGPPQSASWLHGKLHADPGGQLLGLPPGTGCADQLQSIPQ